MLGAKDLLDYSLLRLREKFQKLRSLIHSFEYFSVEVLSHVKLVLVSVLWDQKVLNTKVEFLPGPWLNEKALFWEAKEL